MFIVYSCFILFIFVVSFIVYLYCNKKIYLLPTILSGFIIISIIIINIINPYEYIKSSVLIENIPQEVIKTINNKNNICIFKINNKQTIKQNKNNISIIHDKKNYLIIEERQYSIKNNFLYPKLIIKPSIIKNNNSKKIYILKEIHY